MKQCFFAFYFLSLATSALAASEAKPAKLEKTGELAVEPIKITEQASASLFERVREAHLRALQQGIVTPSKG